MKLTTQNHYKIDVKFLVQDEEQTLSLKVNCMTPRKINDYADKLNDSNAGFDDLVKNNCNVTTGWEGVVDSEGKAVEYTPEKLEEIQYDYFGLADAIAIAVCNESKRLREKNLGSLEKVSE